MSLCFLTNGSSRHLPQGTRGQGGQGRQGRQGRKDQHTHPQDKIDRPGESFGKKNPP